jgi:threonine/homoserine/homoserine lactone efflux protein
MTDLFVIGTTLGLSAGLAPGPLLTLVVTETLHHGPGAGVRVALAPLITDLPIIVLSLFFLMQLSGFSSILGVLSLLGACFIFFLGVENLTTKGLVPGDEPTSLKSLNRGVLANALSPHPYLFWLGVGGPIMTRAWQQGVTAPLAFFCSFYFLLVGSKVAIVLLFGRSRGLLQGRGYISTMRFLGLVLCLLGIALFS